MSRAAFRSGLSLLLGLLLSLGAAASRADAEAPLEKRVKAAFLYKFASYVGWPEGVFAAPDSPLVFGVLGDRSIAEELDRAAGGRSIEARPLRVKVLSDGDDFADVNVLFVGTGTALVEALRAADARPMLVVTEAESALTKGSVINFIVVDGRVRFEISTTGAEQRGLKLSSRLLAVAYNLRPEEVR
ncbi:MAG TPA: YfiR family protein [Tahibacter sp.]|uniref:YfiR family protein n=1 Tax=Tahibacter sp. TaxID=2056211 RepID=UPI002C4BFFF0|nr:YfiR family protein [Tahibacter sp.]HSX61078.1 YfiR family protein [Tahibacter sp.]